MKTKKCDNCGSIRKTSHVFKCSKCFKQVCLDCFDFVKQNCVNCDIALYNEDYKQNIANYGLKT